MRKRGHRIQVEGQILPLLLDFRPPLRIPQELPLEQWLDILDLHPWISAQAGAGSLRKKVQRGSLMDGVCIEVGSTIGLWSVRRGKRLRRLRQLENK